MSMSRIPLHAILFLALIFGFSAFGQSISDVNGVNSVVTLNVNGNTFDLYVTPNQGNSGNPYAIFLPMGTTTTSNTSYSYYANRSNLPLLTGEVTDQTVSANFRFNINIEDPDNEIYAAVGTGSSYEIVKVNTLSADNSDLSYTISLNEICSSSNLDCTSLEKTDPPNTSITTGLFFFISNSRGTGQTVDPSSLSNGIYYTLNMSNRIYTTELQLFDLLKGDEQLVADFRGFTMVNYRGLYAIKTDVGAGACASPGAADADSTQTLGSLGVSFTNLQDLLSTLTIGQVKVEGLTNDFCYGIRVVQCDLYGFCSRASQQIQNHPEDIQTLLEKQACFFFTAGFGERHYVVDYFQEWRDQVLRKFWLGRLFVKWYYSFAPQHTPFILERPWLQKGIRGVAYVLYGVIKYWFLFLFLSIIAVVQFRRIRTV